MHVVGLDKEYEAVSLSFVDMAELKDAKHALALRNRAQVDKLIAGKTTGSGFAPWPAEAPVAIPGARHLVCGLSLVPEQYSRRDAM